MDQRYETEIAQDEQEIFEFVVLLKAERVTSYLEIGSKFGGSLWRVGRNLPKGSRIVSVDMPEGTRLWRESRLSLMACADRLREMGHDVTLIWGDSQKPEIVERVRKYAPFDCVLIDADHRLPGVTKDWESYSPMARIVAFHDISWHREPEWKGVRIDVPQFWDEIKTRYRHEEFRFCPTGKNNGVGVAFRDSPTTATGLGSR